MLANTQGLVLWTMSPSFVILEPGKWVSSITFNASSPKDVKETKETQIWLGS
jgi:hypothetical protein